MKIYHYTTIEALALILESKCIKFSRLDLLDDKTESESFSNFIPFHYIFSSSYTNDAAENIPLWKMYSNMETGIRLEFDTDTMFSPVKQKVELPFHKHEQCICPPYLYTAIPSQYILNSDYCLLPQDKADSDYIDDCIKIKKITYLDNFQEFYKSRLESKEEIVSNKTFRTISYDPIDFGFYKNKYWEFQKEIRLLIYAMPFVYDKYEISKCALGERLLKTTHILVPLSEQCLQHFKITFAPKISHASRVIVKALLSQYPNASCMDSCLYGTIR